MNARGCSLEFAETDDIECVVESIIDLPNKIKQVSSLFSWAVNPSKFSIFA